MNVIFVGFMGCGKTTVARMLAMKRGMRFVDTDKLIVKKERLSVKEIFEKKGESYFRELEREIIDEYIKFCDNCSVATGGGMPCFFDNMKRLKSIGWVVFLNAPFEVILHRITVNGQRPLFNDIDQAKRLYDSRIECYKKAHFTITMTANKEKESVVELVESLVFR